MKTSSKLIFEIRDDMYASRFSNLYGEERGARCAALCLAAIEQYEKYYGETEVALFAVPGRIELCGAHTEHQNGETLTAGIDLELLAVAGASEDRMLRVYSEEDGLTELDPRDLIYLEEERGTPAALLKGVLSGLRDRGCATDGVNIYLTGTLPARRCYAHAAAFEVLMAKVQDALFNEEKLSAAELAAIGQHAENTYCDEPSGMAEQLACAGGGLSHMDFQDPSHPQMERLASPWQEAGYVCCATAVHPQAHLIERAPEPFYPEIAREMFSVARMRGETVLRNVELSDLLEAPNELRDRCGDRAYLRALYFVQENARVQQAAAALRTGETERFLQIIRASADAAYKYLQAEQEEGQALCQEMAVALAVSEAVLGECGACRVQGDGSSGLAVAIVPDDAAAHYQTVMDALFGAGACTQLGLSEHGVIRLL